MLWAPGSQRGGLPIPQVYRLTKAIEADEKSVSRSGGGHHIFDRFFALRTYIEPSVH